MTPFQYIRGKARPALGQRKIFRAYLTPHRVGLDLECDLLALGQPGKSGALDRADVHEDISAAVVRLDEPEAFLAVEPFHSTCRHFSLQSASMSRNHHANQFNVVDVFGKGARGRDQQGTAANRIVAMYTTIAIFQGAGTTYLRGI
jgi:hypothetical protein